MDLLESTNYLVRADKFCKFFEKPLRVVLDTNVTELLKNAGIPDSALYCTIEKYEYECNAYSSYVDKSANNLLDYICERMDDAKFVEAMKVIFKACEF